jgi:hypothetical protein
VGSEARHGDGVGGVRELVGEGEIGVEVGFGNDAGNVARTANGLRGPRVRGRETGAVARRWLLSIVFAAVLLAVAVFAAHRIRDDESATSAHRRSTTASATSASATTGPTTSGPPGPCGADAQPIQAAVLAAVTGASADAQVGSCRLAASDSSWAAVQLTAKPGAQFATATVIVHDGAGSWSVVAQGGTSAGCGQAPQQVIVDLGQFCAGTGGSTK